MQFARLHHRGEAGTHGRVPAESSATGTRQGTRGRRRALARISARLPHERATVSSADRLRARRAVRPRAPRAAGRCLRPVSDIPGRAGSSGGSLFAGAPALLGAAAWLAGPARSRGSGTGGGAAVAPRPAVAEVAAAARRGAGARAPRGARALRPRAPSGGYGARWSSAPARLVGGGADRRGLPRAPHRYAREGRGLMAARTLPLADAAVSGGTRGGRARSDRARRRAADGVRDRALQRIPAPDASDELLRRGRKRDRRDRPVRERRPAPRTSSWPRFPPHARRQRPAPRARRVRGAGVRTPPTRDAGGRDPTDAALLRLGEDPAPRPALAVVAVVLRRDEHRAGPATRPPDHRAGGRRLGSPHQRPAGLGHRRPGAHPGRLGRYRRGGVGLRILPLYPNDEALGLFAGLLPAKSALVSDTSLRERHGRRPSGRAWSRAFPVWLVLLEAFELLVGLAANEYAGRSLRLEGRREPGRVIDRHASPARSRSSSLPVCSRSSAATSEPGRGQTARTDVAIAHFSRHPGVGEPDTWLPVALSRTVLAASDDVRLWRAPLQGVQRLRGRRDDPNRFDPPALQLAKLELTFDEIADGSGPADDPLASATAARAPPLPAARPAGRLGIRQRP